MAKYHTTPITMPAIDRITTLAVSVPVHQIMNPVHSTANTIDDRTNRVSKLIGVLRCCLSVAGGAKRDPGPALPHVACPCGPLLPQPPNVIRSLRVTVALPVRLTGPPL